VANYFLDDAANVTNDGLSWETCYNTWAQVNTAAILTGANWLIVGADANITDPGAALTITGPTSGLPTTIISSTVATGTTVAYSVGTGKQIDTDSGAYSVTFDGSFALYGIRVVSGGSITFASDTDEITYGDECRFILGANGTLNIASSGTRCVLENCTTDLSADGTTPRANPPVYGTAVTSYLRIVNMTFYSASGLQYRTGTVFGQFAGEVVGCDLSGFTNATPCEWHAPGNNGVPTTFVNCISAATWTATNAAPYPSGDISLFNCGPADAPTYIQKRTYFGDLVSSAAIYRTGGATVEGDATGWLITTTANCGEGAPFYTPWMYGVVSSTGSKTFDCYITNDTADFTDAEVWLEVEYLATADEAQWTLATDQRATITTTAAAQTDDTTSTWNGAGPAFTYKQKLSVPAVIGETGQYRARVAVGVASIAGSRYFYVDPSIAVS
jgi:hypothetical protein